VWSCAEQILLSFAHFLTIIINSRMASSMKEYSRNKLELATAISFKKQTSKLYGDSKKTTQEIKSLATLPACLLQSGTSFNYLLERSICGMRIVSFQVAALDHGDTRSCHANHVGKFTLAVH